MVKLLVEIEVTVNKMNYRTCLLNCLVLISIPLVALIAYFGLNYSGFCFAKMRYLSDEEKIRLVFDSLNNLESLRIKIPGKGMQEHKFIKYESFDKYIKENPGCCTLNPPGGSDYAPPSFLERIFGYHSGQFVRIKFKVRYLDENGKQRLQEIISDSPLQNCGNFAGWN